MSEINLLLNTAFQPVEALPYGKTFPSVKSLSDISEPLAMRAIDDSFKSYTQIFHYSLDSVNQKQHLATEKMTAVSMKQSDDLIGTVMAIQDASLSFQFLLQVRNRMVESYHELFNQQI